MNEVVVATPPHRVMHIPTGDLGTILGVDGGGYLVVRFDCDEQFPVSLRDDVLTSAVGGAQ